MSNNIGRPTKFTPERRQRILDYISRYVPYEISALACGICEETLYAWLRQGRSDQSQGILSDYANFSEAIKKLEADKIAFHVETIAEKPERWQADAWILERRWWKHFSSNAAVIEFNKRLERMEGKSQNGDSINGEVDSEDEKQDS